MGDKVRLREPLTVVARKRNNIDVPVAELRALGHGTSWFREDALEVVESPLTVGDTVVWGNSGQGTVLFVGQDNAVVEFGSSQCWAPTSQLKRVNR